MVPPSVVVVIQLLLGGDLRVFDADADNGTRNYLPANVKHDVRGPVGRQADQREMASWTLEQTVEMVRGNLQEEVE